MNGRGRMTAVLLAAALAVSSAAVLGAVAITSAPTAAAVTVTPPDLQILVPTNDISIGTDPVSNHRQLQFTHITWDAGAGPFAIKPTYDARTGVSTFAQYVYHSSSPGHWALDHKVALPINGIFDSPSDYRYPLTRFTLNAANSDGSPGALVATSPKTDYCITADTFVGGVPNTPSHTSPPQSNCTKPSALLGFSVGWGDEYDQTDDGQPIDLTGIPDGNYVLRATVDPQHIFAESDHTNDVVDTELHISGSHVTVLSQTSPTTVPPTISLTSPAAGAQVQGTVTLSSTVGATAPATPVSVQYLLDGNPLGAPVTAAPWSMPWTVGLTPVGAHRISAQVTDSNGDIGTAPSVNVSVAGNSSGGLAVDASVTRNAGGGASVMSPALTTTASGDTVVAFASLDGPNGGGQSTTISGAGLTWHRAARANGALGDAEIWTATAPSVLTNAHVTSTPSASGFAQQLTVVALRGAGGVGGTATASAPSGAPSATLTTQAAGSLSLAVGDDWDRAAARSVGAGQTLLDQWVDNTAGDTFWVQGTTAGSTSVGQSITLDDTAPTGDQWNLAAVEITPATPPAAQVVLVNPAPMQALSASVPLAAVVHTAVAIRSVRFLVDGHPIGHALTAPPYTLRWNTASVPDGTHEIDAVAVDARGRISDARHAVVVTNPARPMTCFVMQFAVSIHGGAHVSTPPLHTAADDEQLLALVQSAPGTAGAASIRGAGAKWTLVRRVTSAHGDVAVWTAVAPHVLTAATITSAVPRGTQDVTVVAMEGSDAPAASIAASGVHARGGVALTTTEPTSLVFAVGVQSGSKVAVPAGWAPLLRRTDGATGLTAWVQYTNQPARNAGTAVAIPQTAETNSGWATVAFELPGDD